MKVTDLAASKIELFLKEENTAFFRVKINTGGCSGFSYMFATEKNEPNEDDTVIDLAYGKLLVDAASFELLKNSTLDYLDEIGQAGFAVINPDAKSTCGCGISFDF